MTTTPARIHCCVPFCKRTAKVIDPLDPGEMICREHGALTSKHTRRFMLRMRRKAEKAMQQAPDYLQAAAAALELNTVAIGQRPTSNRERHGNRQQQVARKGGAAS